MTANMRSAAPVRNAFARFVLMPTRWRDNDVYGHMNNVVPYEFFDTAVNDGLIAAGLLDAEKSPVIFLVVETGCRFFSPLMFPQQISVGLAVARLGEKSVTYRLGLFSDGAETAAMAGHFVHVAVERGSRRAVPIPQDARPYFQSLARSDQ